MVLPTTPCKRKKTGKGFYCYFKGIYYNHRRALSDHVFKILVFALGPDGDMSIPGEAGVDFPVYSAVPDTGFDCGAQEFPGIYGDVDGNCQVFHMCAPNGNADSCE